MWISFWKKWNEAEFKPLRRIIVLGQNDVKTAAGCVSIGIYLQWRQKRWTCPSIIAALIWNFYLHIVNLSFFRVHVFIDRLFLKTLYIIQNSKWPHSHHFNHIWVLLSGLILYVVFSFGYFDHFFKFKFK